MIVLGLILTAAIGWSLLPRRLGAGLVAGPGAGLALGFALGAFGLSAEMFFFDLAGLGWNPWLLSAPWVAGVGWKLSREGFRPRVSFHWSDVVAWLAGAAVTAVWLPYERLMPLTSRTWDTWAIWLFKSKAFFLDGDVASYLARTGEFVGQPGYPLLTPLYGTFLYQIGGGVDDHAAKLMTPIFWLALLGVFHYLASRLASRTVAGFTTALLALTPVLGRTAFELAGYADVPLALYFVAGAGFLTLWLRDGASADLAAAGLAATAAAWTKNEGQLFLAVVAAIVVIRLLRTRAAAVEWAWFVVPPVLLLGSWALVRSSAGVQTAGFTLGLDFDAGLFATAFSSMLAKAFTLKSFALTFPLLVGATVALAGLRAPSFAWVAPGLALAQLGGALLAYATGRNEIQWWLETSADRLLAQVVPLALLSVVVAVQLWDSRTRGSHDEATKQKSGGAAAW